MCTSIAWRKQHTYFGRNLDIDASYGEQVIVTPRRYEFSLKNGETYQTKYAMMGMGLVQADYPLYYEAFNEAGLATAGLNFPKSAVYQEPREGRDNISPFELLPWILGQAESVAQARGLLERLNLTNIPFGAGMPLSPLHFMLSDGRETIVVEPRAEGLRIYGNPYDTMTNEPPFPFHLWNLQQYRHLSPQNPETRFSQTGEMASYAVGMGAVGLPGDASSVSRFVRTAFHLANADSTGDTVDEVTQFFHILDGSAMIRGTVLTEQAHRDLTVYSCCMDLTEGVYYYKTYENSCITALSLKGAALDGGALLRYDLRRAQTIHWEN